MGSAVAGAICISCLNADQTGYGWRSKGLVYLLVDSCFINLDSDCFVWDGDVFVLVHYQIVSFFKSE